MPPPPGGSQGSPQFSSAEAPVPPGQSFGSQPNGQDAKTNPLAIVSVVSGVLFCFAITPIVAIVTGLIARSQIKKSNGREKGMGLAIGGIVLGVIFTLAGIVSIVALVFVANDTDTPTRAEFNERVVPSFEDGFRETSGIPDAEWNNLQPELRPVFEEFGNCAYDVLGEEPRYLEAVYDNPDQERTTVPFVSQDRIDEIDDQLESGCQAQLVQDVTDLVGG